MHEIDNSLSDSQKKVIELLVSITAYKSNNNNPKVEEIFDFFVDKYLFIDDQAVITGYNDLNHNKTNDFEQTFFFNDICIYLRSKEEKSFIIDNEITKLLKVLAVPYKINHFDPRIYSNIK